MKKIPLTQGKYVTVDDEVYLKSISYKWYARRTGENYYAFNHKLGYLHKFILHSVPRGARVEFLNGSSLDCRRSNLKILKRTPIIPKIFKANGKRHKDNKSGFIGVRVVSSRCNGKNPYHAAIRINGKEQSLGYYSTSKEAALAYNTAAKKQYGEEATLNRV